MRHVPCSCIETAQGDWAKNPDIPLIKMQANILKLIKYRDQKSTTVRFLGIKNKEVDLSGMQILTARPTPALNKAILLIPAFRFTLLLNVSLGSALLPYAVPVKEYKNPLVKG